MKLQCKARNLAGLGLGVLVGGWLLSGQWDRRAATRDAQAYNTPAEAIALHVARVKPRFPVAHKGDAGVIRATLLGEMGACMHVLVVVEPSAPKDKYRTVMCVKRDGTVGGYQWEKWS